MVFVDAGANLGQYTLLAAQRVGASGQVHSFEPSMRMFNELSYNVTLNSLNGICTLNNAALSNLEGTGRLSRYLPGAEVYGSLGRSADPYGRITGYDEVKVTTLDLYAQENAIKHIDMLKIDIEGAELPALRGAHSILGGEDGPAIIIEMADCNTAAFDYKAIEIWDYLVSLGYAWFAFDKRARLSPASRPGDFEAARNLVALKGTDRLRALQSARF
ncbi:MAG: FkbM family methyltransferase [Terriglobia bacterium]